MSAPEDLYPEILSQVAATVAATLVDAGIDVDVAQSAGRECAEVIRRDFSGLAIYIPRGLRYELSLRDRQIYAEWTGNNAPQLTKKYRITERRLRDIIDAMREADRAERQGGLFGDEG